jgi:membrane associated rhomboid family serine protease
VLLTLLAVMWGVELVDSLVLGGRLDQYGVQPRTLRGLPGILAAPFLHGDLSHLATNTIPFLALGWLVLVRSARDFFIATVLGGLLAGMGVWLAGGANTSHVGASGLVFGYFGFLLARAYFERTIVSLLMALIVVSIYGGLIWGVLPERPEVSWQGHLFGMAGGVVAAWVVSRRWGGMAGRRPPQRTP